VTLHVGSGKELHILAPGAEAGQIYVKSVRLNGKLLNRPWILHSELMSGGSLLFEMSDQPQITSSLSTLYP
jgi:putative alpha-1,2-mannosidase